MGNCWRGQGKIEADTVDKRELPEICHSSNNKKTENTMVILNQLFWVHQSIQLTKFCNQGFLVRQGYRPHCSENWDPTGNTWIPRSVARIDQLCSPQGQVWEPVSQITINKSWDKETLSSLRGMSELALPFTITDSHHPYLCSAWPMIM